MDPGSRPIGRLTQYGADGGRCLLTTISFVGEGRDTIDHDASVNSLAPGRPVWPIGLTLPGPSPAAAQSRECPESHTSTESLSHRYRRHSTFTSPEVLTQLHSALTSIVALTRMNTT